MPVEETEEWEEGLYTWDLAPNNIGVQTAGERGLRVLAAGLLPSHSNHYLLGPNIN